MEAVAARFAPVAIACSKSSHACKQLGGVGLPRMCHIATCCRPACRAGRSSRCAPCSGTWRTAAGATRCSPRPARAGAHGQVRRRFRSGADSGTACMAIVCGTACMAIVCGTACGVLHAGTFLIAQVSSHAPMHSELQLLPDARHSMHVMPMCICRSRRRRCRTQSCTSRRACRLHPARCPASRLGRPRRPAPASTRCPAARPQPPPPRPPAAAPLGSACTR